MVSIPQYDDTDYHIRLEKRSIFQLHSRTTHYQEQIKPQRRQMQMGLLNKRILETYKYSHF